MPVLRKKKFFEPLGKDEQECSYLEELLSSIPGGRATAISYIRELALTSDSYKNLIREYDKNKRVDLGKLCEQFSIAPADLLADVNRAAYPVIEEASLLARGIAQGIVSKRLPKVVERGLLEGAKPDGIADRHFTLQKEGFHVAPKGTVISMNQINQQAAGLPSFEDETKSLADILTVDGAVVEDNLLETGETDYIEEFEEDLEEQLA